MSQITNNLFKKEQSLAYKMLIPTILILLIVAVYPLGQVVYTSFTNRVFAGVEETEFVGLDNYTSLFSLTIKEMPEDTYAFEVLPREPKRYKELKTFSLLNKQYVIGSIHPDFIESIINTIIFTFFAVFLETLFGFIIALVVNSKFIGRGVMRAIMLLPWAVITVVSARIWEWILFPSRIGFLNMFLSKLGIGNGQISFLTESSLQLPSLIMVDVWKTTPFMALLILAGLQLIPNELYEASRVDGAGKVKQFFSITLPLLKPSLAVALIFRTLASLRVFGLFQVLVGQQKYSMASYNYYQLIGNRAMGLASAISVVIFIIIFIFAVMYMKTLGVENE
ncbi:Maltose/maltodextrin ABC transporter, permease protein MalF [Halanaerobium saccharolyticum subsp. saccharolyticum DSM 6643]|uniref:Maltose/maltodextrin ABC transporter, permease protein MalF n=1 Tax=Halanaerobium saccharolyticum subsp. saccharolyticum DSM 6643 TaxID=1293054 RepID=M5E286_9FIRM|nr:sugar ABC transporter permease [Halanaerobium saccharolyticum]CCU80119.1 Maltose/maltodextrin ABC transporter, permease protein MalF [Halanaerobium saccharolyticum subsp. saccharolyticum DSM 6643]